ncbi:nucleoredoxin-like [Schistocerca nitens]|uniref:nucleoredoxin-like n=1 Tax=Schistocerca nitens TaxID=7011 RepID=UPI0021187D1E|nr:nucleoredoxin-like [Schistocerca nitens]
MALLIEAAGCTQWLLCCAVLWKRDEVKGRLPGRALTPTLAAPLLGAARLCRRYRARSGCPSLVLLEGGTGRVLSAAAGEHLLRDPEGRGFPWRPRPVSHVLHAAALVAADGSSTAFRDVDATIAGLYFSAHWCPPCKAFTPQLVETYHKVRARGHRFQVIFVSSDR